MDLPAPRPTLAVLFYVPNLIGYARLCIILAAHYLRNDSPTTAVILYLVFAMLDGVDGWLARKLNQCSSFGAWLDVVLDNVGRTMMWSNVEWGFLVSNVEWITFVCNQRHGPAWKDDTWKNSLNDAPGYVSRVMANGFKTPFGILAILGLHGLPIWMFCLDKGIVKHLSFIPYWILHLSFPILVIGRTLCFMVEFWCIKTYVKHLLSDSEQKTS